MLFHVTATHDVAHCGAYDQTLQKEVGESWANMDQLSKELSVKIKSWGIDAPGHTVFMLLEADSMGPISTCLLSNPMRQHYDIRPVLSHAEIQAMIGKFGPGAA